MDVPQYCPYTVSMFDASTNERILYFHEDCGEILSAIANDPDIKTDPEKSNRIRVSRETRGTLARTQYYTILELDFTDEEIVRYVMKYMRTGTSFTIYVDSLSIDVEWKSLESLIP